MLMDVDGYKVRLDALLPGSQQPEYQLASPEAQRRLDAGTGLVISANLAASLNVARGQTLALPTPGGSRQLEVVDVVNLLTSAEGIIGISHDWAASAFGRPGFSWLEVEIVSTADRGKVSGAIDEMLSRPGEPEVYSYRGHEFYAEGLEVIRQSTSAMIAMQWAIGLAATLAVASTMLMGVNERHRELGVLRAVGLGASSLRRMLLVESLAYSAVGLAIGIGIGVLMFHTALQAVAAMTGLEFDGKLNATSLRDATITASVLAVVIGGIAARLGSSGDVDTALRYE
jgi:putative ABC transport system permease protein